MVLEDKILNGFNEQETLQRSRRANFKTLGYKSFEVEPEESKTAIGFLQQCLHFEKFHLPFPYDENLIKLEFAPIFWASSSKIVLFLENHTKANCGKEFVLDYFNYIKEFYFKWTIVDSPSEKKYFALSALNNLKRSEYSKYILNTILHAIILLFEKSVCDADEAEKQLNNALQLCDSLEANETEKKYLVYILNIYYGFLFLNKNDTESAIEKFNDAFSINQNGVNASFYLALSHARLNNNVIAEDYIRNVYESDQKRISFVIERNHYGMFNGLVHNPSMSYFFEFIEFSGFIDLFKNISERNRNVAIVEMNNMRIKISRLKEIWIGEYFDGEIVEPLKFLETILQMYNGTENVIFLGTSNLFTNKFNMLIESIRNVIKTRTNTEVQEKLEIYNRRLENGVNETQRLNKEMENFKEKIKHNLKESSERITRTTAAYLNNIEMEIQSLGSMDKFNHKSTFNSTIIYSVIISLIIFMIGGLASYVNNSEVNAWDFKSVMGIVFSGGLKWSAVSIFIGTLVSFILAASTMLEKSKRKLALMREIGTVKSNKEKELEILKIQAEEKERMLEERYIHKINEYNQRLNDLKQQKQMEESRLKEIIMQKYSRFDEQLVELLQ